MHHFTVNEYHTTAACPEFEHRILGERVFRRPATSADIPTLNKSPNRKVLVCQMNGTRHARDSTSAGQSAANMEQRWLVENDRRFSNV